MQNEFDRVGITEFEFINAFDKCSDEVLKLYQSGFVQTFPPCFRCGQEDCNCGNKSLFPPQIGNWLSHMAAWQQVRENSALLTLICEDDIKFRDNIHQALDMLAASEEIKSILGSQAPLLIRLGWALCDEHSTLEQPHLTQDIRMANPCYAINGFMAGLLLDSLQKISTTSDIYLHRIIGPEAKHYTVMPPPVHELSWSTGELLSEIRPKQKHIDHLRSLLTDAEQDSLKYREIQLRIAEEETRLKAFEAFNENPGLLGEGKYAGG